VGSVGGCFFFSSRRRHTRSKRDWSSDVCSSDLGAVKAIKASEVNNAKQFVMVSTYDSRREAFDASGDLKPYTIAKHYADEYLKQASVPYTIVHPGALLNDDGTNKIEVGAFFEGRGSIPREDVASVINEVVT